MANHEPENSKEIDLTQLSKHMRRYYARAGNAFFNVILFAKRNIILIAILFVAGVVAGYFLDKEGHSYENKVLVTPNFSSTDYLYEQVDLLNKKIMAGDTVYLKNLGIKHTKKLSKIEVEPVVDVYGFINSNNNFDDNSDSKYEIFKVMADKGDLTKVIEDPVMSKNFKYHLITFNSSIHTTKEDIAAPILKYLNNTPYYKEIQKGYIESLDKEIAVNDSTIAQINTILNNFSADKGGSTVFYKETTNLNDLIRSKSALLKKQEQNKVNKVNYTSVIKDNATLLNIKRLSVTSGRMKMILPVLFIGVFVLLIRFKNFYNNHSAKRKAAAVTQ